MFGCLQQRNDRKSIFIIKKNVKCDSHSKKVITFAKPTSNKNYYEYDNFKHS